MTIQKVIATLNEATQKKLKIFAVKVINDIRGGGLKESKEIADMFFGNSKFGEMVINHLKQQENWSEYKSNIRKMKEYGNN